ncbi:hypothetical protein [Macrococcoides caseolyticum]|uniref:hypothetical protein n=1 Tax=Macrococcoides caseolyticum TaxID=69966 RepID=UPI00059F114F|nr:hypothetical protein [Macrococcus caseolyticus]
MKYLAALVLQTLLTLVALAISLTSCVFLNLSVDPIALALTLLFFMMLVVYGGTDAGKILDNK